MKKLTSIPLVFKKASSVAYAPVTIFTEQGPPSILQTDNGGEFSGAANDSTGIRMCLEDDFVDQVIKEVKLIWPEVLMVRVPLDIQSQMGVSNG
jgi:hypothetical protein